MGKAVAEADTMSSDSDMIATNEMAPIEAQHPDVPVPIASEGPISASALPSHPLATFGEDDDDATLEAPEGEGLPGQSWFQGWLRTTIFFSPIHACFLLLN